MAKKNYNYGKIVDGKLVYAPNMLAVTSVDKDGNEIRGHAFNASSETYLEQGWYPIVKTSYPDDGKIYEETFEMVNNTIHNSWIESENQEPYPISDSERIDVLEQAFLEYVLEKEKIQNG